MKWSAAEALSWINGNVPTPLREWNSDMWPGIEQAQRELSRAVAEGRVHARGRVHRDDKQPSHDLLEDVPPDPFRTPGVEVVVGVHGEMMTLPVTLPVHKRYAGPRWRDLEFDEKEVKQAWPKSPLAVVQDWMRNDAERLKAAGPLGKRDDMVDRCMKATGCTKREAESAHKALPTEFRRTRGKPSKSFG